MSRKWAATESDSEDEEHVETPLTPVNDQPIELLTVESSSGYDGPLSGMMMNIKYSATEDDVRHFLESNNCKIRNIEFFFRDNEFTGRARIDFIDKVSFDQFLALHDKPWDGKPIITKVYEERTPRSTGGRYGGSSSRGGGRGDRREGRGDRRDDRNINKTSSRDSRDGQRYGDFRKSNSREDKFDSRPKRPERDAKPIAKIPEEPEAPKERPRVILQPRTKPLETIGKTDKTSDIFGGGKPHDEFAYEEKKKQHVVIEKKPESEPVDELKVDKISLQEEVKPAPVEAPQPVKKEEEATVNNNASTTAEPPKAPATEEEEDNGQKGKYKSNKPTGGRNNNNERRYNNDRGSRNFTKNRSKDEDKQPEAESSEPVGEKAEEPEQTNNDQGERKDRRSYRKPKGERFGDDREFNGERKPFKKNDNKGKREKQPAASSAPESQEEKKKLEVEVKAEPTKDEEGFEDYTKSKNKAKVAQKAAATSTKSTSSATTPKSSAAPVSVKNAFAGLDSDSD